MIRFSLFSLFYCLSTFLYSQNSIRADDLNYSVRGGSYDQKVHFPPGISGKDILYSYRKQSGYIVVDGFIVGDPISQKEVPDDFHIVRRAQINDDEDLAAIGFRHRRGGIDLFESEGSALHKHIYSKYRDESIPFAMWGYIIPLVINGRLISPFEK